MEIKGIDISSVQGDVNCEKIAKSGIKFAILRVHQRYGTDTSFENNYNGCRENGILVGAYKYSYALNTQQAEEEADAVLKVLAGRKLDFPVFYDLEWSEQRALGRVAITKIAKAFLNKIEKAGYIPAIYCNVDWYNNVLDVPNLTYDYWLASYPANDTGAIQERLRPSMGVGWQYSSKGRVPGISGNVDMDVFYKDYKESGKETEEVNQAKLIMDKSSSYIGVAENPTGSNNVIFNTHYYGGAVSGSAFPWCCVFVWDIFRMCGLSKLFYDGKKTAYCPAVHDWAKKNGLIVPKETAKYGDVVLFDWNKDGVADHIGFVESYNGVNYTTIEGNTSDGNDSNGGKVMRRTRYTSQIQAIIRPKYSNTTTVTTTTTGGNGYMFKINDVKKGEAGNHVLLVQEILRARGFKGKDGKELQLDRKCEANTVYAIKQYQKDREKNQPGICGGVDGIAGEKTLRDMIAL